MVHTCTGESLTNSLQSKVNILHTICTRNFQLHYTIPLYTPSCAITHSGILSRRPAALGEKPNGLEQVLVGEGCFCDWQEWGCGRQPERYGSALNNNCTQTQNSDYTYTVKLHDL